MMTPAPSCSPVRQRLPQLPWRNIFFSFERIPRDTAFLENSRPHLPWQCICRGSCNLWSHRRDLVSQHTGHLSNKEHRPDILFINIFKKNVISNPCKVMEGWILSGVSAPHGVSVQEEGLRCARRAHFAIDVFTTSTGRLVFYKSSPNVQRRKEIDLRPLSKNHLLTQFFSEPSSKEWHPPPPFK